MEKKKTEVEPKITHIVLDLPKQELDMKLRQALNALIKISQSNKT